MVASTQAPAQRGKEKAIVGADAGGIYEREVSV